MINTTKSIKATLQSLLLRNLVDETFVEDVRDALMCVDNEDDFNTATELFEGTLKALDELDIDVNKMRNGEYNKQ